MSDRPDWFAPKRYGYGAAAPITWQGWALTIGYVVLITGATPLLAWSMLAYVSFTVTLTALFLLICRNTTRGGWRWRRGEDD